MISKLVDVSVGLVSSGSHIETDTNDIMDKLSNDKNILKLCCVKEFFW